MEVTARLLLQPNGHFQYELAYGALDEIAEGTWDIQGSSVFLTTVPTVNPPRFEVLGYQLNQYGILNIRLDNFPIMKGASQRVYLIYGPNEPREMVEVAADGNVPLPGNRLPTAFIPVIPGYPITLKPICLTRTPGIVGATGTTARMGHFITLRFDKNDLGKADFHPQVLIIANGVLVMTRPDLRLMLNFKREPSR